jgi:DNA sulfur modification protein DndD
MIIRNIRLQNFQCYYGENEISLSEGLNLILGANGFGKSKLYDAFYWLFQDRIFNSDTNTFVETAIVKDKLVCDKSKAECLAGQSVITFVELEVEHTSGVVYRLKRTYRYGKNNNNEPVVTDKSQTDIMYQDVLHFKPSTEDFDNLIEKMIPNNIIPYVWFKGEQDINSLVNTSDEKSLKDVIKKLSNISSWEIYKRITEGAEETANKELAQARKQLTNQADEISALEKRREKIEKEINDLNQFITSDEEELSKANDIQEKYFSISSDAEKIQSIKKELDNARGYLNSKVNDYQKVSNAFTSQLFDSQWVLLGLENYVSEFAEKIGQYDHDKRTLKEQLTGKRAKFKLPAHIPDPIKLEEMLKEGRCFVCNQTIAQHSDAHSFVMEKISYKDEFEGNNLNDHQTFFESLRNNALKLEDKITQIPQDILAYKEEEQLLLKKLEDANLKIEELEGKLDKLINISGVTNAEDITASYQSAKKRSINYAENIGSNKTKLRLAEKELIDVESKLQFLTKDDAKVNFAQKVQEMIKDLKAISFNARERVYNQLINRLENRANEHFTRINNLSGAFVGKIIFDKIGNGYKPKIISNGVEVSNHNTSNLSAMKLSIILAIISTKEQRTEHYPLIADAPVSDFDELKTSALLCEIGSTFKQSIIIFKEFLKKSESGYIINNEAITELRKTLQIEKPIYVYELKVFNEGDVNNREQTYTQIQKVKEL